ncbi:MAG: M3 family oligoendopeptidase [Deltaproteobacteria bacterium]|jgi:M3 family oligoendopeptidase|nr:M3 family oligoendopeptidase [Deltaproteobacteria bacterium]MBT6433717.1 M3 family oligoendopeptidase [Deltaproteobacteria bacterium]MBT6489685.1 M3 family oligoendopeptidase [Deltaproteobacteria bacterium]
MVPDFKDVQADRPSLEEMSNKLAAIQELFHKAGSQADRHQCIMQWDSLRRNLETWTSLTHLNFAQDTKNPDYKAEQDFADEVLPGFTNLEVGMKQMLLGSEHRQEMAGAIGDHAFRLWESDIKTFDPVVKEDLVQEAKLKAKYIQLMASAEIEIDGKTVNLPGIQPYITHENRELRYEAVTKRWKFFEDNQEQFDGIYNELTALRTKMAKALNFKDYVGLGYERMQRVDYNAEDVARFRKQVVEDLVPLCVELREKQREALGVEKLMYWDEAVHSKSGNPTPKGGGDWMIEQAKTMFNDMNPELGDFFSMMADKGYLDLETREGKAGGGFCTSFPSIGVPFVFANFNGTKHDAEVFTHEIGHAFQNWCSRKHQPLDYLWPTYESCEIHSMSLEFLCWPHMELFFKESAEEFRKLHLIESLFFIPYGVAVDDFQHRIYENPDATPEERHAMWLEVEKLYMPWRDYGDLDFLGAGRRWQLQRHIYLMPFYYIDYTLAQTCALQFWVRAEEDRDEAMASYVELCKRGGKAAFQTLARSADLVSPLEDGCLKQVVAKARKLFAEQY